jgi:hypothetical protein
MRKPIFLLMLILTTQILAQPKAIALKFDEFSSIPDKYPSPLIERGNRLAKQFLKSPKTSRAVIIYYNQRKDKFPLSRGKEWADYTVGIMVNGYDIPKERILLIDGGYRQYATLEYWIAPPGAELPKPSPTIDTDETVVCPEINAAGSGFQKDRTGTLRFSVAIRDEKPGAELGLEWNVSAGKIVKGQGTNQIEVDLSETEAATISAAVEVKGLHPECDNSDFTTTQVGFFPYKFDEFAHVPYSDLAARLHGFMGLVSDEPTARGHIIIYAGRDGSRKNVAWVTRNINQWIKFRHFDRSRMTIVDGGFREEMTVEFYLVPAGVADPKPAPTLDPAFVPAPKKAGPKSKKKAR